VPKVINYKTRYGIWQQQVTQQGGERDSPTIACAEKLRLHFSGGWWLVTGGWWLVAGGW
jgi:hypothetical protein